MPLILVTNCWLFLEGQEGALESHGLYLETDTDYPDSGSSGKGVCMCVRTCTCCLHEGTLVRGPDTRAPSGGNLLTSTWS